MYSWGVRLTWFDCNIGSGPHFGWDMGSASPLPSQNDAHGRPKNLNAPESDQPPLCRVTLVGRALRYDTTNARVRDYRKYCTEKKRTNLKKATFYKNILKNSWKNRFYCTCRLFLLSFLLSSLLRDEVKSKSRYAILNGTLATSASSASSVLVL